MKNSMLAYCVFSSVLLLSACSAGYVASRPADVEYVRPVSPGPGYVWIGGEWEWRGGNYHWRGGNWEQAREGHPGNQDIGKTAKRVTGGKKDAGNKCLLTTC